jgi:hypothetical protein
VTPASPRRPRRLLLALSLCALVLSIGGAIAVGHSGPAAASTAPPGNSLPLQEFISDHQFGRIWNDYNQTVGSNGPTVVGRVAVYRDTTSGLVHLYGEAPNGDLTEFVNDNANGQTWNAYDLSYFAGNGAPVDGSPSVVSNGLIHVYVRAASGDLVEYVNDSQRGHLWNVYDLTVGAQAGWISGQPSAVFTGPVHVYAHGANGKLMEYVNDGANGRLWNAYDLSDYAGGSSGNLGGSPDVLYTGALHVYVESAGGHLVEYVNDQAGGHLWNAYDTSIIAGNGGPVSGTPSAVYTGPVHVYVPSSAGHLTEYVNDGAGGHLWNAYDLSYFAGSGSPVAGSPAAITSGNGGVEIFARASNNHLTEYVNDQARGSLWNAYDLTAGSQGATVGSDPGVWVSNGVFHVYSGGPLAPGGPPATGVGVYGVSSWTFAKQAIGQGWTILGDTGGLGTCNAPYTAELGTKPDLAIGSAITSTQVRDTWLSFWTVSGPSTAGQGCGSSTETTTDTWYNAGNDGGRTAASAVDNNYRSSGIRPDFVILDAEGYNGAPSTPTQWHDFVQGWADGLTAVDPLLHPGFYANQGQYYSGSLAALAYPAFVAVSPIICNYNGASNCSAGGANTPNRPFCKTCGLGNPGNNITGYIEYGDFNASPPQPNCPAAPYEAAVRNWGAPYNTIQFPDSGDDCAP